MYDEGNSVPGQGGASAGLAGVLLQTGAALYDSAANRKAAKYNTDATNAANAQQSQLAYQRDLEMWKLQNEYNSPEAQMQRFKAAGLNPQLIYGQGSPGNATGQVHYQPAHMQYNYQAFHSSPAVQSILPTLMSVGSWMQDMRLKDAQISQVRTNTIRADQVVDFLRERNPQLLEQGRNTLEMFPYQREASRVNSQKALGVLRDMELEHQYRYGRTLFGQSGDGRFDRMVYDEPGYSGLRRLQFLAQESETRLKQAQASWTDFSVTSPQSLMQLVLSGVMGLANQQIRLSTYRHGKKR